MADELRPLPYYKWHWQDWRANRTVQRMSYIERGIYRELLDECWSEGFIPYSVDKMADIVGCPSDVMADAWQVLSKCFVDAGEGRLINERLNIERTVKDSQRVTRAINGQKGGQAKSLNEKENEASAKQLPSKCHIEEKRREEKRREEHTSGTSVPNCPHLEIIEAYNSILGQQGLPIVRPGLWAGSKREIHLRARWKEDPSRQTVDFWERFFAYVAKSDFLMGRVDGQRTWRADLGWLINRENFDKVFQGNYNE